MCHDFSPFFQFSSKFIYMPITVRPKKNKFDQEYDIHDIRVFYFDKNMIFVIFWAWSPNRLQETNKLYFKATLRLFAVKTCLSLNKTVFKKTKRCFQIFKFIFLLITELFLLLLLILGNTSFGRWQNFNFFMVKQLDKVSTVLYLQFSTVLRVQ